MRVYKTEDNEYLLEQDGKYFTPDGEIVKAQIGLVAADPLEGALVSLRYARTHKMIVNQEIHDIYEEIPQLKKLEAEKDFITKLVTSEERNVRSLAAKAHENGEEVPAPLEVYIELEYSYNTPRLIAYLLEQNLWACVKLDEKEVKDILSRLAPEIQANLEVKTVPKTKVTIPKEL